MNEVAQAAAAECDVVALHDRARAPQDAGGRRDGATVREDDRAILAAIPAKTPVVLVLNKIDRIKQKQALFPLLEAYGKERDVAAVVPVSALKRDGIEPHPRRDRQAPPRGGAALRRGRAQRQAGPLLRRRVRARADPHAHAPGGPARRRRHRRVVRGGRRSSFASRSPSTSRRSRTRASSSATAARCSATIGTAARKRAESLIGTEGPPRDVRARDARLVRRRGAPRRHGVRRRGPTKRRRRDAREHERTGAPHDEAPRQARLSRPAGGLARAAARRRSSAGPTSASRRSSTASRGGASRSCTTSRASRATATTPTRRRSAATTRSSTPAASIPTATTR